MAMNFFPMYFAVLGWVLGTGALLSAGAYGLYLVGERYGTKGLLVAWVALCSRCPRSCSSWRSG